MPEGLFPAGGKVSDCNISILSPGGAGTGYGGVTGGGYPGKTDLTIKGALRRKLKMLSF